MNWCQSNRTGIARLDSYYNPNERKYYITPQSVELAIAEEKARAVKNNGVQVETIEKDSETVRNVPQGAETTPKSVPASEGNGARLAELEKEVMDLRILNKGKDFFIEQLKGERFDLLEQAVSANRKIGELEATMLLIRSPAHSDVAAPKAKLAQPGNGSSND